MSQISLMKKTLAAVIIAPAALTLTLTTASAQRDFSKVEIKTVPVAGNVHMLVGAGGNIAVSSGDDGIFMIDDQFAPLTDKIIAAVKGISDKPIRFLLNTHWHFDHTGGNQNMVNKTDVTIIASEAVRNTMAEPQELKAFNRKIPASPKEALPMVTFRSGTTYHMNGETIRIRKLPNAHTDGDSFVQFERANVIHTGDTFFNGFYPFIDVEHGGSVNGMIKAIDEMLRYVNDQTKIIPGHGPLGDKAALIRFQDMLKTTHSLVLAAKKNGQGPDQLIQSAAFKAVDEKWGGGFLKAPVWLKIAFAGST